MRFQWLVLDFFRFRQESKEEGRILYYQLPPLSCPHWSFIFPDLVPSFFKVPEGLKHTYYPSPELSSELPQRARVITGKIKAGQVFEPTSGRNASERECSRGRRSLFLSWGEWTHLEDLTKLHLLVKTTDYRPDPVREPLAPTRDFK